LAEPSPEALLRPFGAKNRAAMLDRYFDDAGAVTPENAWAHVYRLLLWIDRTTGLAHCYESDKAQPGRPWYGRSLAFHAWVARELDATPLALGGEIDWLFRQGTAALAAAREAIQEQRRDKAAAQRDDYADREMPEPGEDSELELLIREGVASWLASELPTPALRLLTEHVRTYLAQENKRKNLVGEGFEDVLAALIQRLPGASSLRVMVRPLLHDIPGFHTAPAGQKPRRVDLAIILPNGRRVLVSAKWSVRADREEQFGVDHETYSRLENLGRNFDFVLVTNEFDAARLVAACRRRISNADLFTQVVHVNSNGPLAAYGAELRRSARELPEQITKKRLIDLDRWLTALLEGSGAGQ
jgi:hypothetical protein